MNWVYQDVELWSCTPPWVLLYDARKRSSEHTPTHCLGRNASAFELVPTEPLHHPAVHAELMEKGEAARKEGFGVMSSRMEVPQSHWNQLLHALFHGDCTQTMSCISHTTTLNTVACVSCFPTMARQHRLICRVYNWLYLSTVIGTEGTYKYH